MTKAVRLLTLACLALLILSACGEGTAPEAPTVPLEPMRIPRPPVTVVDDPGFADEPSLALAADGTLYVAYVSFRQGQDTLQLARYRLSGERFLRLDSWQVDGGEGIALLGPKVVAGGGRIFVVYAAERSGNWDVYAVEHSPNGLGGPIRLTTDPGVDIKPAATYHGDRLWISWESNRGGQRHIHFTSVVEGRVQGQEQISGAGQSNYSPTITASRWGLIAVAWHSWRDDNYDIYLRERLPTGQWSAERRLTNAPTIDRNPVLASYEDDIWLVYENARSDSYAIGRTLNRRLVAAKVTAEGLCTPRTDSDSPLEDGSEAGNLIFDQKGRLWIAYLASGESGQSAWSNRLTAFNGQEWERPRRLSQRLGMDRTPGIAVAERRIYIAFQADEFPQTWVQNDPALTQDARSRILLAGADLADIPEKGSLTAIDPLLESETSFEPAQLRHSYGEDLETPSIDYQGSQLNLYYGDLHTHTEISVCGRNVDQSVDEAYQVRRDINTLDFVAITDHGYNITPYLWSYSAKMARANEDPGRFLTFLAEEWTSSFERYSDERPYGYYGHRNLIHGDPFFGKWWDAYDGQTPAELWTELRSLGANFVQIPHQLADTGNVPTDWDFTDETAQPVAEIFQVRGSYEYFNAPRKARRSTAEPGYYLHDAWARGIVIGVIASPDHGGGRGKACVWSPALTRTAILDAIRARHTFGTTAARVVLEVRVNGHLMGEKIDAPDDKPVEVIINVTCPADIAKIEICRNNEFIYSTEPGGRTANITYTDQNPLSGSSYYYVRVTQVDDELAWSSPVWLGVL